MARLRPARSQRAAYIAGANHSHLHVISSEITITYRVALHAEKSASGAAVWGIPAQEDRRQYDW
jgi:hypothetical protein